MAKFGRSLLTITLLGAAAAGAYYYLKKKDGEVPADMDDDEDFDNFDADVEDGAGASLHEFEPADRMTTGISVTAKIDVVAPHDHDFSEWELISEPTCEENGMSERACSLCGQ